MMKKNCICEIVQLLAVIVFAIGLSAIYGHIIGETRFYRWSGTADVGVAINTAIAFVINGIGLFMLAHLEKEDANIA